ncbi:hypothetical protein CYV26_13275 [Carnobacterium maltaromaticum]|uniref:hypothetical protein n=1 Tax=Carnobacterium maltaromaticum TaxID=2751 RepID=UPI000C76CFE6|nr:hypothetical protein [Carnobacterium maltaromaticum]PLS33031.1 hypothetical protein CYV33_13255 [Carnobacterium maltaromaticum]PLS33496.1 hypothetical protein CYV31_13530 [Carnobacterium maltaromaticum]PLS33606.1 hypothetical protein CYV30_13065 [Carnobacterium maltaromaticum]PLS41359.1 hypothetical protein CYV28_13325 [Carnobacterium maltaromaticum]PLS42187.1 hypothetical protein CYV27_12705 [Carnobacterium maltaromaticum]
MNVRKYKLIIILLVCLISLVAIFMLGKNYVRINKKYENVQVNEIVVLKNTRQEVDSLFTLGNIKHQISKDSDGYLTDKVEVVITSTEKMKFPIQSLFFINDKGETAQAEMIDDEQESANLLMVGGNHKTLDFIMKNISKGNPPEMIFLSQDKKGIYTKYRYK